MKTLIGENAVVVTPSDTVYITDSLVSRGREADVAITSVVLATGVFTKNAHGYTLNDVVQLSSLGTTTGLVLAGEYYVTNVTTNTFTVANTMSGTTITLGGTNATPPTFFIVGRRVVTRVLGSLYIGVSGNLNVLLAGHPDTDNATPASRGAVLFKNVPVGPFPYAVKKVFVGSGGNATTATDILAIY